MERLLQGKGKNQLLARDDIGKAKPATRDLPPEGFAFGKPDKKDPEGAGIGKFIFARNSSFKRITDGFFLSNSNFLFQLPPPGPTIRKARRRLRREISRS